MSDAPHDETSHFLAPTLPTIALLAMNFAAPTFYKLRTVITPTPPPAFRDARTFADAGEPSLDMWQDPGAAREWIRSMEILTAMDETSRRWYSSFDKLLELLEPWTTEEWRPVYESEYAAARARLT
jgi:hypothetical protein